MATAVTAIFDIGKTNKKFFLFDDDLNEVLHEYHKLPLITDDDGFECDDIEGLTHWMKDTIHRVATSRDYRLTRMNFSTYGASLVHIGENGKPVTPLYNYLKPFPDDLTEEFYTRYPEDENNLQTASPSLGMLNSGLQLYWLKRKKPALFRRIKNTIHFPQFPSYLFTGKLVSEPTSIGCHTKLWDYQNNRYHDWLRDEGMLSLLPEIVPATQTYKVNIHGHDVAVGVGIHDSSSALAAYLMRTDDPFALISTGTWSITLNPYTDEHLTREELNRDCLNFLTIEGKHVKASRLFLGHELDHHLKVLNEKFHREPRYYKQVMLDPQFIHQIDSGKVDCLYQPQTINNPLLVQDVFHAIPDTTTFTSYEEAYHHLVWGLVKLQVASSRLALGNSGVKKIFLDGGFIDNDIFVKLLQYYLKGYTLEVSHMPLGSAQGAALVMHRSVSNSVL